MSPEYLDVAELTKFLKWHPMFFAVHDHEGSLCGYAVVEESGHLAILARFLGHANHLDNGIMYLLMGEIVRELCEAPPGLRRRFLMYDTYFGASPQLRYFKERVGFLPYRVRWTRAKRPRPGTGPDPV